MNTDKTLVQPVEREEAESSSCQEEVVPRLEFAVLTSVAVT